MLLQFEEGGSHLEGHPGSDNFVRLHWPVVCITVPGSVPPSRLLVEGLVMIHPHPLHLCAKLQCISKEMAFHWRHRTYKEIEKAIWLLFYLVLTVVLGHLLPNAVEMQEHELHCNTQCAGLHSSALLC